MTNTTTLGSLQNSSEIQIFRCSFSLELPQSSLWDNKKPHPNFSVMLFEGFVAQWCNPLTLQPEQSCGVGSKPGRAPPLEHHDKGSQTQLALSYFCDPSAW